VTRNAGAGTRRASVDSRPVEARDRIVNLALLAASAAAWVVVAVILTSRDPYADPTAGYVGAIAVGVALALLAIPLCWLVVFARHRRIAYQGDWARAARRGAWIGLFAAALVILRLVDAAQLPIVLFLAAIFVVAEVALSSER
jgi:hypothetical protein